MQRSRGPDQNIDQILCQVIVAEVPRNTKEEYLQLHLIPYLQSEIFPLFEASLSRQNAAVKNVLPVSTSQFTIILSNIFSLADERASLNLGNMGDH